MIFKKVFDYIFYNPYRVARKYPNISIHPDAILLKTCRFRFESLDSANKVSIGSNSMIGALFVFESNQGEIHIGDNTFINGGTRLISRSSIKIGNGVTIAWDCIFYDHNSHSLDYLERIKDIQNQNKDYRSNSSLLRSKDWSVVKSSPISIENNAWIGFGAVILNGVTIGEGAIVGALSVVRNDVEPWTVVAGNPAVVIKRLK